MKRIVGLYLPFLLVFFLVSAFYGYLLADDAGAATYASRYSPAGAIERTAPFRAFGNLSGVPDCQYEAAANLVLSRWPHADVTYKAVLDAFYAWTINADTSYQTTGLWDSQDFLMKVGFAGHRASRVTQIPEAEAVAAANAGGVEVTNLGPVRNHMFDIIAATKTHVTIVDDGYVFHYTWAWLNYAYATAPGQQGEVLDFYAVTWA